LNVINGDGEMEGNKEREGGERREGRSPPAKILATALASLL